VDWLGMARYAFVDKLRAVVLYVSEMSRAVVGYHFPPLTRLSGVHGEGGGQVLLLGERLQQEGLSVVPAFLVQDAQGATHWEVELPVASRWLPSAGYVLESGEVVVAGYLAAGRFALGEAEVEAEQPGAWVVRFAADGEVLAHFWLSTEGVSMAVRRLWVTAEGEMALALGQEGGSEQVLWLDADGAELRRERLPLTGEVIPKVAALWIEDGHLNAVVLHGREGGGWMLAQHQWDVDREEESLLELEIGVIADAATLVVGRSLGQLWVLGRLEAAADEDGLQRLVVLDGEGAVHLQFALGDGAEWRGARLDEEGWGVWGWAQRLGAAGEGEVGVVALAIERRDAQGELLWQARQGAMARTWLALAGDVTSGVFWGVEQDIDGAQPVVTRWSLHW